jgi:hypothetical protein
MTWIQIRDKIVTVAMLGSLIWILFTGFSTVPSAVAVTSQIEEIPGQWVYQSRTILRDPSGNSWQAIAFKRVKPESTQGVYLRLVGFPDAAHIDPTEPLTLETALGQSLTAPNITHKIFNDTPALPNIGQYDLHLVMSEVNPLIPLRLGIPTQESKRITLWVSPQVLQEWNTIARIP